MAFVYRLEHTDGTPADPLTYRSAVPNWSAGDTIPLGQARTLSVIETGDRSEPNGDPVLVVEAT